MRRKVASGISGRREVAKGIDRRAYRSMSFVGRKINTSPYIPRGGIKL